jgi:hypothetical protein
MTKWPDPWSGRRSRRGREHGDEPIEEYEPDEMPVKRGYWANYGKEVGLCAVSVAVCGVISLSSSGSLAANGFRGLLYLALFVIFGVVPAVLPFVWYQNYRRMRALYLRAQTEQSEASDSRELRQLDDDSEQG